MSKDATGAFSARAGSLSTEKACKPKRLHALLSLQVPEKISQIIPTFSTCSSLGEAKVKSGIVEHSTGIVEPLSNSEKLSHAPTADV